MIVLINDFFVGTRIHSVFKEVICVQESKSTGHSVNKDLAYYVSNRRNSKI